MNSIWISFGYWVVSIRIRARLGQGQGVARRWDRDKPNRYEHVTGTLGMHTIKNLEYPVTLQESAPTRVFTEDVWPQIQNTNY